MKITNIQLNEMVNSDRKVNLKITDKYQVFFNMDFDSESSVRSFMQEMCEEDNFPSDGICTIRYKDTGRLIGKWDGVDETMWEFLTDF